ncbi:MAG: LVIVD repeat-containing protein [Thermoleophilaceae bacterium]
MRAVVVLATAILVALVPTSALAADEHSRNLSLVENLPYEARNGTTPNFGTDIEFARIGGRQYALAGSYRNGLQVVDVTKPGRAEIVAVYDCGVTQGDVQIFRQADKPGRIFAGYTSDTYGDGTSTCYREAETLGFNVKKSSGAGKNGTFIVELTNPKAPTTVSFVEVEQGSHNHSIHPSGRYLYNSNSDLMTSFLPAIEIFDISNFAAPAKVGELALPTRPGLGTESHDITFSDDGNRAYSAALSQGVVIDTTDPAAPSIVSSWLDPAINVWHQADPFSAGGRDFVFVEDEFAGAAGGPVCPSGGFHIYEVTGELEQAPKKIGYWNIDDVGPTQDLAGTCTAHVFDIHEREQVMTVAYYNGGVRVVDLSGLDGGEGLKQIGFYKTENADSWSAKTPRIERDGSFYLYGNDIARGLDVYRYDATKPQSDSGGTWLGAVAAASLPAAPRTGTNYVCLIQQ